MDSPPSSRPDAESGIRCPSCRSVLLYRDIFHQVCGICGEPVGIDRVITAQLASAERSAPAQGTVQLGEELAGDWDPAVPIW
jgi:hypothetical protein